LSSGVALSHGAYLLEIVLQLPLPGFLVPVDVARLIWEGGIYVALGGDGNLFSSSFLSFGKCQVGIFRCSRILRRLSLSGSVHDSCVRRM
jgi:hypothetical protein